MNDKVEKLVECHGTLKCPEIDQIGEYPYHNEVEFNMAVWEHCEKCVIPLAEKVKK